MSIPRPVFNNSPIFHVPVATSGKWSKQDKVLLGFVVAGICFWAYTCISPPENRKLTPSKEDEQQAPIQKVKRIARTHFREALLRVAQSTFLTATFFTMNPFN